MALISSSGTSTSLTPSGTSTVFAFHTISTMIACNSSSIVWDYNMGSLSPSPFPLVATNIGVSQSGTTGAPQVNETLTSQTNPLVGSFNWNPVNVPQGWYRIVAYVSPSVTVNSNDFLVVNGSDTSCLTSIGPSSSTSVLPPSPSSSSSSTSSTVPVSTAKSNNSGIIAGGVVGGLAFVALIIAILFFWRRRLVRRTVPTTWAAKSPGGKRARPKSFTKVHHGPSDSTGAILAPVASTNNLEYPVKASSSPSSEVSMTTENEFMYEEAVAALPSLPNRNGAPSATSSLRSHLQRCKPGTPVHENPQPGVPLQQRSNSNSGRSVESTSNLQKRQHEASSGIPGVALEARFQSDWDRTSSGRRASRKPVPTYDASEFDLSTSGADISMDTPIGYPTASQSSFMTDNGDKPVHYLMPDFPAPVKA